MANCLVTQFKESVQNDSLVKLGEAEFTITSSNSNGTLWLYTTASTTYDFSNPVTVKKGDNIVAENVITYTGQGDLGFIPQVNTKTVITARNKYNICRVECPLANGNTHAELDIKGIEYIPFTMFRVQGVKAMTGVDSIGVLKTTATGKSESTFTHNMINIRGNRDLFGNIDVFKDRPYMRSIVIVGKPGVDDDLNNVSGNIEDLSLLIEITELDIRKTQVTGNADVFLGALAASERTVNLILRINPSLISLTGKTVATDYTIRFNSSMVNPTEAETARGWQIA